MGVVIFVKMQTLDFCLLLKRYNVRLTLKVTFVHFLPLSMN